MSFTINLYSGFTKKLNSTKQPTTVTTALTGELKRECSVEKPVIEFIFEGNPSGYVYAYIPAFNRYYFITDWKYNITTWEAYMEEDYLASWKTYIGNTHAYVERAASDFDGNIIDNLYPTAINSDIYCDTLSFPFYQPSTSGCFVVGIIDSNSDTEGQLGGAVTYYVMTPAQIKTFMEYLQSDQFLSDVGFPSIQTITSQMDQTLARAFVKPIDYIVSCMWYPFPYTDFQTEGQKQIKVGYWAISTTIATGYLLHHGALVLRQCVQLRNHPDIVRGAYVNYSPYTRIDLNIQPFGNIPIDTSFRALGNYMHIEISMDTINGKAELYVTINNNSANTEAGRGNEIIANASAVLGVPIQLAQVQGDYLTAISESAQMVGDVVGLFTGGTIGHVANAAAAMAPQIRSTGIDGSKLYTIIPPVIRYQFLPLVEEDNNHLGKPLMKEKTINTLSGYIKCIDAHAEFACYSTEKEAIESYMTDGFFYE